MASRRYESWPDACTELTGLLIEHRGAGRGDRLTLTLTKTHLLQLIQADSEDPPTPEELMFFDIVFGEDGGISFFFERE